MLGTRCMWTVGSRQGRARLQHKQDSGAQHTHANVLYNHFPLASRCSMLLRAMNKRRRKDDGEAAADKDKPKGKAK